MAKLLTLWWFQRILDTSKTLVAIVKATLFVRRAMVRVRAVRYVMEQASTAPNAMAQVIIQHVMEQECAHIATMANAQDARAVVEIVALTASVMEIAQGVEAQEHIRVLHVLHAKVMEDAPNAMDRVPQGVAPNVLEVGNATHVMAIDNARHVMEREIVSTAVEIPDVISVVATAIALHARIVMASVIPVVAKATSG